MTATNWIYCQESTLHLVIVLVLHQGKTFASTAETIGSLKLYILEREGIPVQNQTLTYMGRVLSDGT
jgi:hypothetical protein